LSASSLATGTLADGRLGSNVVRTDRPNTFGELTLLGGLTMVNGQLQIGPHATALEVGRELRLTGSAGLMFTDGTRQTTAAAPAVTRFVVGPTSAFPYQSIQAAVTAAGAA